MDIKNNKTLKKYLNSSDNKNEKKTVENFLKQNRIDKRQNKKKSKSKNVNFIDDIDKNKNIAEIINIQSYKELNTLDDEEDENFMNIEKTRETVNENCTCTIL